MLVLTTRVATNNDQWDSLQPAGCPYNKERTRMRISKKALAILKQTSAEELMEHSGAAATKEVEQVTSEMGVKKKKLVDPVFGELIYSYTRAQAIEDGVLVDVTKMAREAGFTGNTAVTQALWATIHEIPENFTWESIEGRLWDVLWLARMAAGAKHNRGKSRLTYRLKLNTRNLDPSCDQIVELVLDVGPGDHGEIVVTIGYEEDF
jgi:hypothetical protein